MNVQDAEFKVIHFIKINLIIFPKIFLRSVSFNNLPVIFKYRNGKRSNTIGLMLKTKT